MKELETHQKIDNRNQIELNVKKKQKIESELLGSINVKTGHFLWEINEETGEIKKAEFKKTTAIYGAKKEPEELIVREGCVYIPALNKKNAIKKYLKDKEQSSYYSKPPLLSLDFFKKI